MNELQTTLGALVAAENDGYAALIALLHDETRSLCVGDTGVLQRQAEEKLSQVRELERLFAERQRLSSRDPAASAPADNTALRVLHERAAEAKRINALNGRLIDRHQQYASRSLAALRNAAGHPSLYGADGQSSQLATSARRISA